MKITPKPLLNTDPPAVGARTPDPRLEIAAAAHRGRADYPSAAPLPVRRGPVPVEIKALAQRMLAQGASAEEVVATARAKGFGRITEATVKHWLSRYPKLRERGLQRQIEAVKLVEKKLARRRRPEKERLAEGVRLVNTVLPAGTRSRLDVPKLVELHASVWDSLQRENVLLKHRALELEAQKASIAQRIDAVRALVDRMRWQAVQRELDQLWDAVHGVATPKRLGRPIADALRNLYRAAGRFTNRGSGPRGQGRAGSRE